MTGKELLEKLTLLTKEELEREIVVEDYSGCTAQFLTLNEFKLQSKRDDLLNDSDNILGKDYLSLRVDANYYLG